MSALKRLSLQCDVGEKKSVARNKNLRCQSGGNHSCLVRGRDKTTEQIILRQEFDFVSQYHICHDYWNVNHSIAK